jgi:hypothetical protein
MNAFSGIQLSLDLPNLFLLVLAAFGLFFTYRQIQTQSKTKRSEFLVQLWSMPTEGMNWMFYEVEWDEFKCTEKIYDDETILNLDNLLDYYDLIGRLYFSKQLSYDEVQTYAYAVLTVHRNVEIQKYLSEIDAWTNERRPGCPRLFDCFRNLAEVLERPTNANTRQRRASS